MQGRRSSARDLGSAGSETPCDIPVSRDSRETALRRRLSQAARISSACITMADKRDLSADLRKRIQRPDEGAPEEQGRDKEERRACWPVLYARTPDGVVLSSAARRVRCCVLCLQLARGPPSSGLARPRTRSRPQSLSLSKLGSAANPVVTRRRWDQDTGCCTRRRHSAADARLVPPPCQGPA